jgi:RNA polymerase sigma factor for flagellar operon FliA
VKFETYALTRIRGEVIDVIRSLDWTPRSVRKNETILRDAYARLEMQFKRPPTDTEVAQYLEIEVTELEKMLADAGQSALLSLDEMIASGGDILADSESEFDDPASCAERADQKRLLVKSIDELPDREKQVVALYYYENLTQKEIAAVLGVTESRVCQIHTKAVLRLSGKLSRTSACFALAA